MTSVTIKRPYYKLHADTDSTTTTYFNVKQLAAIYNFPPVNTAITNVVGVISFGGGLYGVPPGQSTPYVLPASTTATDVQKYWSYLGFTAAQMPKVIVYPVGTAVNNLRNTGGTGENTMDVSIIGGCCPNPNLTIILFLFSQTYSFSQALPIVLAGITVQKIKYVPTILSISWGAPEIRYLTNGVDTSGELTRVNTILQAATAAGVNICVAAGDNGSTDGTTKLSVDFPSCCPYVTALGGTSLDCPSKTTYDSSTTEIVWNDGILRGTFMATGGGISAYYTKPSYQQVINSSSAYRNVPDIALDSDPSTGLILYLNGQLQGGWGGTSMAAPLFAGYLALINPKSFVNPLLYSAAAQANNNINNYFHDIITGNNDSTSSSSSITKKSYTAGIGYDCCTGLGSINGINLKTVLISAPTPVPVPTPTPVPVPVPAPAPTPVPTPVPMKILSKSISLNKTNINLNLNTEKTFQLIATILPANTSKKNLYWICSNTNIATVTQTGLVTVKNKGNVRIAVITQDGTNIYAVAYITVASSSTTIQNIMRSIIYK